MSFIRLCVVGLVFVMTTSCQKSYVTPDNVKGENCSLSGTIVDVLEIEGGFIIETDDGALIRPVVDQRRPCPVMNSIEAEEGMRVDFSYKDLEYILEGIEEGAPDATAVNLLCLAEEGQRMDDDHK